MSWILMVFVCGGSSVHCEWKSVLAFDQAGACIDALNGQSNVRLGEDFIVARCVQRNTEAK